MKKAIPIPVIFAESSPIWFICNFRWRVAMSKLFQSLREIGGFLEESCLEKSYTDKSYLNKTSLDKPWLPDLAATTEAKS